MASGPSGKGESYWALIRVKADLSKPEMAKFKNSLKKLLSDTDTKASIVGDARVSDTVKADLFFRPKLTGL